MARMYVATQLQLQLLKVACEAPTSRVRAQSGCTTKMENWQNLNLEFQVRVPSIQYFPFYTKILRMRVEHAGGPAAAMSASGVTYANTEKRHGKARTATCRDKTSSTMRGRGAREQVTRNCEPCMRAACYGWLCSAAPADHRDRKQYMYVHAYAYTENGTGRVDGMLMCGGHWARALTIAQV